MALPPPGLSSSFQAQQSTDGPPAHRSTRSVPRGVVDPGALAAARSGAGHRLPAGESLPAERRGCVRRKYSFRGERGRAEGLRSRTRLLLCVSRRVLPPRRETRAGRSGGFSAPLGFTRLRVHSFRRREGARRTREGGSELRPCSSERAHAGKCEVNLRGKSGSGQGRRRRAGGPGQGRAESPPAKKH